MDKQLSPTHSTETMEKPSLQERHPDWPKLNVSFYFSPHDSSIDHEDVPRRIAESDIYLYENNGGSSELTNVLQQIADDPHSSLKDIIGNGPLNNGESLAGSWFEPALRGIYKSGKAIGCIDLADNETLLTNEIFEAIEASQPRIADTFEDSLAILDKNTARLAELQLEREAIMANKFEDEIERLLNERPELKDKPELNVLLTIGSLHTTLRHTFDERGIPSEREFSTLTPYVHSYKAELERTYMYGREPGSELLEKAWVEAVVDGIVSGQIKDKQTPKDDVVRYVRSIVSRLDHEQCLQFYQLIREQPEASFEELHQVFNTVVAAADKLPDKPRKTRRQIRAIGHLSLKGSNDRARRSQ